MVAYFICFASLLRVLTSALGPYLVAITWEHGWNCQENFLEKRNFIQATTRHLTPRVEVLPVLWLEGINNYSNTFKTLKILNVLIFFDDETMLPFKIVIVSRLNSITIFIYVFLCFFNFTNLLITDLFGVTLWYSPQRFNKYNIKTHATEFDKKQNLWKWLDQTKLFYLFFSFCF